MNQKYKEYIASKKWRSKVKKLETRLQRKNCAICHVEEQIDTHHITYERLGKEHPYRDLVFLCRKHHYEVHGAVKQGVPYDVAYKKAERSFLVDSFSDGTWVK